MADGHPGAVAPEAAAAFERAREELAQSKLVSKQRLAALALRSASRTRYAEFEVTTRIVTRTQDHVEVPLRREPASASVATGLWDLNWPASRPALLESGTIEARKCYEILTCTKCEGEGKYRCESCRGEGELHDPENPYRPQQCDKCEGKGMLDCAPCQGMGRSLRYLVIQQKVDVHQKKLKFPEDAVGIPNGPPSGSFELEQPRGPASPAEAVAALTARASALSQSPWREAFGEAVVDAARFTAASSGERRLGWLSVSGRWFEGWELECEVQGAPIRYFAPDHGPVVGPRLHDPRKLGGVGAVAAAVILVLIGGALLYSRCSDEPGEGRATEIRLDDDDLAELQRRKQELLELQRANRSKTTQREAKKRRQLFEEMIVEARAKAVNPRVPRREALAAFEEAESFGTVTGEDAIAFSQLLLQRGQVQARHGRRVEASELFARAAELAPDLEGLAEAREPVEEALAAERDAQEAREVRKQRRGLQREAQEILRILGGLPKRSRRADSLRADQDPTGRQVCESYMRRTIEAADALVPRVAALPKELREAIDPAVPLGQRCVSCEVDAMAACQEMKAGLRKAQSALRAWQRAGE